MPIPRFNVLSNEDAWYIILTLMLSSTEENVNKKFTQNYPRRSIIGSRENRTQTTLSNGASHDFYAHILAKQLEEGGAR